MWKLKQIVSLEGLNIAFHPNYKVSWYNVMVERVTGETNTESLTITIGGWQHNMCFVCGWWSGKKLVTKTRKVFLFLVFPSLYLYILNSNKDIRMDSNQLYNLIQIGWNKPKKDSWDSNRAKYACTISDLLRNIAFHVNTLTYSFRLYLILRLPT